MIHQVTSWMVGWLAWSDSVLHAHPTAQCSSQDSRRQMSGKSHVAQRSEGGAGLMGERNG